MSSRSTTMSSRSNKLHDAIEVSYPSIVAVIVVPVSVVCGFWWIGVGICLSLLCLCRYWWSHHFGLLNIAVLVFGISVCFLAYVYLARNAAQAQLEQYYNQPIELSPK